MKMGFRVLWVAVLVALGVWLWTILFPSPQKIIRHRLDAVAKCVSFAPGEGMLVRLVGAQGLAGYFATNAEINLEVPGRDQVVISGRHDITQAVLTARSSVGSLKVKFLDVSVTVAPNRQSATVDMTVDANVSDQQDVIVQETKITFRKINGEWLITRVETIRTLSILDFEPARAPSIVGA
jgi:hypothetical protein